MYSKKERGKRLKIYGRGKMIKMTGYKRDGDGIKNITLTGYSTGELFDRLEIWGAERIHGIFNEVYIKIQGEFVQI